MKFFLCKIENVCEINVLIKIVVYVNIVWLFDLFLIFMKSCFLCKVRFCFMGWNLFFNWYVDDII